MKKLILILTAAFFVLAGCATAPVASVNAEPEPDAPSVVIHRDMSVSVQIIHQTGPLSIEAENYYGPTQAISGLKNVKLEFTDVVINFKEETLSETIKTGTPVDWIENLPDGLSAKIREARGGSGKITILVEGVPRETKNEPISLNIPGSVLTGNSNVKFVSTEAKFEILDGSLLLANHVSAPARVINYQYINGTVRTPLNPIDIRINLTDAALKDDVVEAVTVDWIKNLPKGLTATLNPAPAGSASLVLTLTGTPLEPRNEPVVVVIKNTWLGDIMDLNVPNEQILFRIMGASLNDVLIDGSVDFTIASKDVLINLEGVGLAADIAPGTVVSWISNIPAGLTARIKRAKTGESLVIVTVAGTPRAESSEALTVVIPTGVLRGDQSLALVKNDKVRFSISANTARIAISDLVDGTSNPNWMRIQQGPLNIPVLPSIKDFDGLGIVSVSVAAVEKLGADNQYHWSGQKISYSRLMEEAKKLGAHAIINVVIDYVDAVEYQEVKRELAQQHEWTADELDKLSKGILIEKTEGGTRFSVEMSHTITRTYTGTALAIKYLQGLNYYEAEKLRH